MPCQFNLPSGVVTPNKAKSEMNPNMRLKWQQSAKSLALGEGPPKSAREIASARPRSQTAAAQKENMSKLQQMLGDDAPAVISIDKAPILGESLLKVMDENKDSEGTETRVSGSA